MHTQNGNKILVFGLPKKGYCMKRISLSQHTALVLVAVCTFTPALFSSDPEDKPVRIKIAAPATSEEESLALAQALAASERSTAQERSTRQAIELESHRASQALAASRQEPTHPREQAELERALAESKKEFEKQEKARLQAEQKATEERERAQEEQQRQERERRRALERAEQEREQKEREEREAKAREDARQRKAQAKQKREDDELAAALKDIAAFEEKERALSAQSPTAQKQTTPPTTPKPLPKPYTPDVSTEELNRQIAAAEQAAYEKEQKASAPFFESYEQAIAPSNTPQIKITRPTIIQQKELECGYYATINGALLYNAFRSKKKDALAENLAKLANPKEIGRLLAQAQKALGCPKTLEGSDIIQALALYNIPLDGTYSMYYDQLPDDIIKLDKSNKEIVATLKKLHKQKDFTHIFFLRKAGAHAGQAGLGHWISVVAHNNDNKSIDLYVLDSQYPQGSSVSDRNIRMNHDKMWQALAILLYQTGQQMREQEPD